MCVWTRLRLQQAAPTRSPPGPPHAWARLPPSFPPCQPVRSSCAAAANSASKTGWLFGRLLVHVVCCNGRHDLHETYSNLRLYNPVPAPACGCGAGSVREEVPRNGSGCFYQIFQPNKWRLKKQKAEAEKAAAAAAAASATLVAV